jgi:glutathione S-transferase
MALHEKNLPFDSKRVNLTKTEQYQPWFLYLNPRGEVPVLQDTGKIIVDSANIINYLEDNFNHWDTPRLIPMDQGPEVRQRVTHFRHLLQKAPAGMLKTGAMLNQHLLQNPKTPFIGPVRKALASKCQVCRRLKTVTVTCRSREERRKQTEENRRQQPRRQRGPPEEGGRERGEVHEVVRGEEF